MNDFWRFYKFLKEISLRIHNTFEWVGNFPSFPGMEHLLTATDNVQR